MCAGLLPLGSQVLCPQLVMLVAGVCWSLFDLVEQCTAARIRMLTGCVLQYSVGATSGSAAVRTKGYWLANSVLLSTFSVCNGLAAVVGVTGW